MVLTRTFTVELVMARSGDRTATDLPAVLDSCKLMVRGSSLTRLSSQLSLIFNSIYSEDDVVSNKPFVINSTTTIKAAAGQGCPRCGGAVFAAEQQLAKGTMWHQKCFSCAECKRPLDSMLACDGPDKEIHCRSCYGRLFGPKGFGYGHTPTLSTSGESTMNK